MADSLKKLRGNRSQEEMAAMCDMSLRHYSDLERQQCVSAATTLLYLYTIGIDLNRWAEDTLKLYEKMCEEVLATEQNQNIG